MTVRFRVEVDPTGDVLQAEHLARNLRDTLNEIPGLSAGFASQWSADPTAKGAELIPTLLLAIPSATVSATVLRLITTRITEQTKRAKNRKVHLSIGDDIKFDAAGMSAEDHSRLADLALALVERQVGK